MAPGAIIGADAGGAPLKPRLIYRRIEGADQPGPAGVLHTFKLEGISFDEGASSIAQ